MRNKIFAVLLIGFGFFLAEFAKPLLKAERAYAEVIETPREGNDALWHLPKFSEAGWFVHASNGRVRACNLDKVSVVGNKNGPRCTNWE